MRVGVGINLLFNNASPFYIYNNIIYGFGAHGLLIDVFTSTGTPGYIFNNSVISNKESGLYVFGEDDNLSIKNNIFYDNASIMTSTWSVPVIQSLIITPMEI